MTTHSHAELSAVIAETLQLSPEEISDATGPATEARWTSLKHVQLVVAVEEAFGLSLSHQEMRDFRTVGDVRAALRRRGVLE